MPLLQDTKLIIKISIPILVLILSNVFIVLYSVQSLEKLESRNKYLVEYYFSRLEMFGQVREQFLEAGLMNRNIIIGQPESEIPSFRDRYDRAVKAVADNVATLAAGSRRKEIQDIQRNIGRIARAYFDLLDRANALALRDERDTAIQVGLVESREIRTQFNQASQAYEAQATARLNEAKIASQHEAEQARTILIGAALAALLTALGLSVAIVVLGVTRPLHRLVAGLQRMAEGDVEAAIPEARRGDEIGIVGRAVEAIKAMVARNAAAEVERKRQADTAASVERRRNRMELAQVFEQAVATIVERVSSSAGDLQTTARQMTTTAREAAGQSGTVARAAEAATANINTVAASAEELGFSIQEIGRQASDSSGLAQQAVDEADQAAGLVSELRMAVSEIDTVVRLISSIAEQTNLLALNATIEAARAGEAGRGFAVVAGEVKALAEKTGQATDGIAAQIGRIQGVTGATVGAIGTIIGRIREINGMAVAIAAAVDEQGAATQEIVRNITQATQGASEVTANIAGVAEASEQTGRAADQVLTGATALAVQSERLSAEVDRFLVGIRAA